jgi:glycosyltransferase involved in cell wall biosynthesis
MSPVLVDLTELLINPLHTGIQRVEREIIRLWPGPRPLAPIRFDPRARKFVRVPDIVMSILGAEAQEVEREKELLSAHVASGRFLSGKDSSSLLFNPEVFHDSRRAEAYCAIGANPKADVAWLVYDFFPFLYQQYFQPGVSANCMHYVCAMQSISRACFISEKTKSEFVTRVIRNRAKAGPVFPLGGDGLNLPKCTFDPEKKLFLSVGSIEPRKNVADILLAFELLWQQGVEVELTIIGRMVNGARELPIMERLKAERRFTFLGHTDDKAVKDVLQRARATLFVSAAEGFGIPPYESLAASVPVIASAGLPSLDLLPPKGRLILPEVNPLTVAAAVMQLLDNRVAQALWDEAAQLVVPGWKAFVDSLAAWLHGSSEARKTSS